jgi:CheY-like chemotaxis protein
MGYKLLLADDSITIQKVVSIIFANEDYSLTVVDNGNEALDKAREIMPDVILIDALMPGKSGYDVCGEVRQDPALKAIPILLLVGAFEPFDEEKAALSGADDHISKPFESQTLIEKVRKLVELGEERVVSSAVSSVEEHVSAPSVLLDAGEEQFTEVISATDQTRSFADESISVGESPDELSLESMEVVEVTPEDDLWGAFDVTEVTEGEDVQLDEILEGDELQPEIIDTVEEIEPFVFTEEEQASPGVENTISLGEFPDTFEDDVAENEESFVFREDSESDVFGEFASSGQSLDFSEPAVPVAADEVGKESHLQDVFRGFGESAMPDFDVQAPQGIPEPPPMEETREFEFTPDEKDVAPPLSLSSEGIGIAAEIRGSDEPGTVNLSEEQLATIISTVSREIIEKIAWEVVPDLAETIIREEIRKIKEGT